MTESGRPHLPDEIADWVTKPLARFLRIEAAAGVLLFAAAVLAMTLSNSAWSVPFLEFWQLEVGLRLGPLEFSRSIQHWINDGLMTLFFFVIALELKRELVLGELNNPKAVALPLAAAIGGMIIPASVYVGVTAGQPGSHGWGTVMATDTAFVMGCLALFGSRVPPSLRLFLLSLAIFDDVGAILLVAGGYSEDFNLYALTLAAGALAAVAGLARVGIRSIPVYFLMGSVVWLCFDASGVHATISGVILGLMTPTGIWVSDRRLRAILDRLLLQPRRLALGTSDQDRRRVRQAGRALSESLSPVERLEMMLHPWVGFCVMPLFALANAGVIIKGEEFGRPVPMAILGGLVLGKPIGVLGFTWLAVTTRLGVKDPQLSWPFLVAGAFLTGIGFTMSLFIADLAFAPDMLIGAKLGVMSASVCSASLGLLMLLLLTRASSHGR